MFHSVAKQLETRTRISGKATCHLLLGPEPATERIVDVRGQIPVVDCNPGRDAVLQEGVDEVGIEARPVTVHVALQVREQARPRDGEAVRLQAEPRHDGDVVPEAVVVVAGDVAGVQLEVCHVRQIVPDRRLPAPLVPAALYLVRRRPQAPHEAVWELAHVAVLCRPLLLFVRHRVLRALLEAVAAPGGGEGDEASALRGGRSPQTLGNVTENCGTGEHQRRRGDGKACRQPPPSRRCARRGRHFLVAHQRCAIVQHHARDVRELLTQ
mmetsp:Transcript_74245/g.209709  ORF Transcript_74245/g.209709 Transcript_74245/m.209709 type:complete len:268 (+) Transcript_74245:1482-2285(+)